MFILSHIHVAYVALLMPRKQQKISVVKLPFSAVVLYTSHNKNKRCAVYIKQMVQKTFHFTCLA